MHAFNVGDWVICPEDNAIFLVDGNYNGGYQSTEYWSGLDFILWEPKKGEWVVIADDVTPDLYAVFQFNNHRRDRPIYTLEFLQTLKD